MDALPLSFVDGGFTMVILVLIVAAFVRDAVVSGKRHREEVVAERERTERERQEKLQALDMVKAYGTTLEKLLGHAETTNAVLRSLPHPTTTQTGGADI